MPVSRVVPWLFPHVPPLRLGFHPSAAFAPDVEASVAAPRNAPGRPPKAYTPLSKAELAARIETEKAEVAAARLGGLTEIYLCTIYLCGVEC